MTKEDKDFITYPIKVEENLWNKFKDIIPRTKNLTEAIIELIEEKIKRDEKKK